MSLRDRLMGVPTGHPRMKGAAAPRKVVLAAEPLEAVSKALLAPTRVPPSLHGRAR